MPRPPAILQNEFPYSVGGRCINRDWFELPMPMVWELMSRELNYINKVFDVRIHSFVLMSNHFHLLISTPEANLSMAMAHFMRETSRDLTHASKRINSTWGARHFRSIVDSHHYFLHAYKYFYRNPVVGGLVERVEEYPYSTLSGLLGKSHLYIPLEDDLTLFSDVEGTLNWLNTPTTAENWKFIGTALRKRRFRLPLLKKSGKLIPHPLERDRI